LARLFEDGFENGDFSAWTGTTIGTGSDVVEVITTAPHHGSYHAHFYYDNVWNNYNHVRKLFTGGSRRNLRFYMQFNTISIPSGQNTQYATLWNGATGRTGIYLCIHNVSGVNYFSMIYRHDATQSTILSDVIPETEKYYCFELELSIGSGNGFAKIYIDGEEVLSATALDNSDHGTIDYTQIGCWNGWANGYSDVYVDCVVIADAYIGQHTIFSDGFEGGNFDVWTANGVEGGSTISVLSESPFAGTKAAKVYFDAFENDAYVYKSISLDEVYLGCRLNVSDFHGFNIYRMMQFLWLFRSSTPNAFLLLKAVDDTSAPLLCLGYYDYNAYTQVINGTHQVSKNAYHWCELYWKRSTGTIRVWLDGSECTELRVDGGNFGANPVDRAGIGAYQRGIGTLEQTEATIYVDDVVVSDVYIDAGLAAILKEVADSFSLQDSLLCNKTLGLTDSVGIQEVLGRNKPSLPILDFIALNDHLKANKLCLLTDSVSFVDLVTVFSGALIKSVVDAVGLHDAVLVDKPAVVTDAVSLLEQAFRHKSAVSIVDFVGAVEVVLASKVLAVVDSAGLSDFLELLKALRVSDSLSLVDAVSTPSRFLRALDSLGLADGALVNKVLLVSENVSLAEVIEVGTGGVKKTRLFLLLGDLAIQLTG
jgi:hypothetical protein